MWSTAHGNNNDNNNLYTDAYFNMCENMAQKVLKTTTTKKHAQYPKIQITITKSTGKKEGVIK